MQVLILCEKPDAAAHLAQALDEDNDSLRTQIQGVPFYRATRGKDTLVICSAIGHLYGVDSKGRSTRRTSPAWDCEWKPKHLIDRKSVRLSRWLSVIKSLAASSDRYINACDYDVEGSLIGYTILRYACDGADKRAFRMKFSTMTEQDLQKAYRSLTPNLDFSQVEAGRCRHEIDWLYGINLSRILTESALREGHGYTTLSTGRVQGPTLKFIVDREEVIQTFTPTPFWTINAKILSGGLTYAVDYELPSIPNVTRANRIVEECDGALLLVEQIDAYETVSPPPHPFDLSTLQSEAYRHFGLTPVRTLALAERLYLEGAISYPRTSSQVLPPDIGYKDILNKISAKMEYRNLATKLALQPVLRANQGSKQDSAHPAIYPTGISIRRVFGEEWKILDLIIRRFMATLAESSIHQNTKITLTKESHKFSLSGWTIIREGWIEYYRLYASAESKKVPLLTTGGQVALESITAQEDFTRPPSRYNPSSILKQMENANIGTKSTRAETIQTLYLRDYITGNQIHPTRLALKIVDILDQHCPAILDTLFTADLEEKMDKVRTNEATTIEIITEAIEHLRPVVCDLTSKSDLIGPELSEVVISQRLSRTTLDSPCPLCNSDLMIIRSKATGKRFIGCKRYDRGCRFSLPLPQYGTLTLMKRYCKKCGFQLVRSWMPRRRIVVSCPRCYLAKHEAASKTIGDESSPSYLKARRLSRIKRNVREAKNKRTASDATNAIARGS